MTSPKMSSWNGPVSQSPDDKSPKSMVKKARSYFAKVKYGGVDQEHVEVGFFDVGTSTHSGRGSEKWSQRVKRQLVQMPFLEFVAMFPDANAIPFHQVAYFKERGETVLSMKLTKNDKDGAASPPFGTSPVAPCELDRMTAHCHAPNDKSGTIVDAGDADPPPLGPCIAETVPACCWMQILQNCTVADVAAMSGTCTWMRSMCQMGLVWEQLHSRIYGVPPKPLKTDGEIDTNWVRQRCTLSEREARRWQQQNTSVRAGPAATHVWLDGSKAVTALAGTLTIWMHRDASTGDDAVCGKKIATLPAADGSRVTCLGCDANVMITGSAKGTLKVWSMDDLKCTKAYRASPADAAVPTSCVPLLSGLCVSASKYGSTVNVWDRLLPQASPVVSLAALGGVHALAANFPSHNKLYTAGEALQEWDLETAQEVASLHAVSALDDPFQASAVAFHKSLLAVNRGGLLSLYDPRTAMPVLSCSLYPACAVPGAIPILEAGLELDNWKLMSAVKFKSANNLSSVDDATGDCSQTRHASALCIFDIRWCSSGVSFASNTRAGAEPYSTVGFEGEIVRFASCGHSVIASMQEGPCQVYRFEESLSAAQAAAGEEKQDLQRRGRSKGVGRTTLRNNRGRFPKRQGGMNSGGFSR